MSIRNTRDIESVTLIPISDTESENGRIQAEQYHVSCTELLTQSTTETDNTMLISMYIQINAEYS